VPPLIDGGGGVATPGETNSPGRRGHDAASPVHGHPAAAPPLRRVVVHPEVVSQLVGQGHGGAQGVLRVVLGERPTRTGGGLIIIIIIIIE